MRSGRALLAVVLVMTVAACSGEGAGTSGSTSQDPDLSDLSGSWENDQVTLRVNDAGDYVVLASDESGQEQALLSGFVARDNRHFFFVTGIGGECPGQTGVYDASITDDVLTLIPVEDACRSRSLGFGEPLSRQTGQPR